MCSAPMELCSRTIPSTEDWEAVGPSQASLQRRSSQSPAPEPSKATVQPGTVQSSHSIADAVRTGAYGTRFCKYRPSQERTVTLHRFEKAGCEPGISYPPRNSVQSWVQASTYRQVKVTFWTTPNTLATIS